MFTISTTCNMMRLSCCCARSSAAPALSFLGDATCRGPSSLLVLSVERRALQSQPLSSRLMNAAVPNTTEGAVSDDDEPRLAEPR